MTAHTDGTIVLKQQCQVTLPRKVSTTYFSKNKRIKLPTENILLDLGLQTALPLGGYKWNQEQMKIELLWGDVTTQHRISDCLPVLAYITQLHILFFLAILLLDKNNTA